MILPIRINDEINSYITHIWAIPPKELTACMPDGSHLIILHYCERF